LGCDIIILGDTMVDMLPRADEVVIPIEKFTKYALDPINSKGKHIAFERALGYNLDNAELLIANIKENLPAHPAIHKGQNRFGELYSVLMTLLVGANGKVANVLTSWIDDTQTGEMRLTSAYIKKRKGGLL